MNIDFSLEQDLKGLTVTGAEPISYPLTDGILIYLTDPTGKKYILEVGADPDAEPEENPFYWTFGEAVEDQEGTP